MELTAANPSLFGSGAVRLALLVLRRQQLIWSVRRGLFMHLFPTILLALFLLVVADALRWKVIVERELKRRSLVRVRGRAAARITPARGFRLIEACTCERDGKECRVTILTFFGFPFEKEPISGPGPARQGRRAGAAETAIP